MECLHKEYDWEGLERHPGDFCVMDGSSTHNHFYAIGTRHEWHGAIPAFDDHEPQKVVELYIRKVYDVHVFFDDFNFANKIVTIEIRTAIPVHGFSFDLKGVKVANILSGLI